MTILGTKAGSAWVRVRDTGATSARIMKATTDVAEAPGSDAQDEVFELAAGASIEIRYSHFTSGPAPVLAPTAAQVDVFVDDSATVVRTFTIATPTSADERVTFFATSDGTSGGSPRAGTFRLRVQASRIESLPTDWRGNSDDTSTLMPAGFVNEAVRAFLRGGASLAFAWSDASLGGAAPANNRFVFPKSQFFRSTFGATILSGQTTTNTTVVQRQAGVQKSTNTVAASGTTADVTRTGGVGASSGVNNDFDVGDTNTAIRVTLANSTLSSQPWVHFTSLPGSWSGTAGSLGTGHVQADSPSNLYLIDPRVSFSQLLQLNDNVFGTPPSSKNVASGQRLTSDLAFLAARAVDAHGAGINALAWTEKLWDNGTLIGSESSPVASRSTTSQAQGGEAGWSDAFLVWDEALPGGGWTQKETITTSKATGLELSNTRTLTLLSINPNFRPIVAAGPATIGEDSDHWHAGNDLLVSFTVLDVSTRLQATLDGSPGPTAILVRYDQSLQEIQFLDGSFAWVDATGVPAVEHALVASPSDSKAFTLTISGASTSAWGDLDLMAVVARGYINSTPYVAVATREAVGKINRHDGNDFDPTGLFK